LVFQIYTEFKFYSRPVTGTPKNLLFGFGFGLGNEKKLNPKPDPKIPKTRPRPELSNFLGLNKFGLNKYRKPSLSVPWGTE
jgi:hypothetical protein